MKTMGTMNQDHKILSEKQIIKIFQNIEDIKITAKIMWKNLEDGCRGWPLNQAKIGLGFNLSMAKLKENYIKYAHGVPKALKNLAKLRKSSHQFSDFLDRTAIDFSGHTDTPLPLSALLMLPLVRLTQYENYLKDLVQLTPSDHEDYNDLTTALYEMERVNMEIQESRQEAQRLQKMYNVHVSLKGNVPNILSISKTEQRTLIREGPIKILTERKYKKGYLYLFSDVLLLAEINETNEDKLFDMMLPLKDSVVGEGNTMGDGMITLMVITKEGKRIYLGCQTKSERNSWIQDIQDALLSIDEVQKRGQGNVKGKKVNPTSPKHV